MAAAKSKTPAARKRAPGASSRSRSSAKGNKNKQESALFEGGSLAQRNSSEGNDPAADATGEITSAAPPDTKEAGRASSPSGDEVPVSGKEKDLPTARKADKAAKVKPLPADEAEGHEPAKAASTIDELDVGSSLTKTADEVQIRTPIAGGAVKVFHGRTSKEAFASYNTFAQGEHELLPGALGDETDEAAASRDASASQFDKDALERSRKDLERRGIKAD